MIPKVIVKAKNPKNGQFENIGEIIYDDYISNREGGRRFVLCSILQKSNFPISKKEDVYYEVNGNLVALIDGDFEYFHAKSKSS